MHYAYSHNESAACRHYVYGRWWILPLADKAAVEQADERFKTHIALLWPGKCHVAS